MSDPPCDNKTKNIMNLCTLPTPRLSRLIIGRGALPRRLSRPCPAIPAYSRPKKCETAPSTSIRVNS